tara:strand:+ start:518 stop:928 length:411 start_codon:yes stop_codon:yes gene_type:complete
MSSVHGSQMRNQEITMKKLCLEIRKFARKLKKQQQEGKPKRARKPNRPKHEIEVEKAAKAERKAARELKKQQQEGKPKRARKPNRPKHEIEAEKAAKAERKAERERKKQQKGEEDEFKKITWDELQSLGAVIVTTA